MADMTTFIAADHPRATDGTFTEKPQSAPEVHLATPQQLTAAEFADARLTLHREAHYRSELIAGRLAAQAFQAEARTISPEAAWAVFTFRDDESPKFSHFTDIDGDEVYYNTYPEVALDDIKYEDARAGLTPLELGPSDEDGIAEEARLPIPANTPEPTAAELQYLAAQQNLSGFVSAYSTAEDHATAELLGALATFDTSIARKVATLDAHGFARIREDLPALAATIAATLEGGIA